MQKGFKDGLKQGYADNRNKKKAVLHNQNHFKMLATEQPSEGNKEIKKPKSEGKRKDRINGSSQRTERIKSSKCKKATRKEKMQVIHPGQGGTNWKTEKPKQPSATEMDDIRARVDALRTPTAAEAGFAAMTPDAGAQAPPSQPSAPAPQPPADPFAALGVGAHNPVSRTQNINDPRNQFDQLGLSEGRMPSMLPQQTPTQTVFYKTTP